MTIKAVFCLPDYGYDPTEAAVPFGLFTEKGWEVFVATEYGKVPRCDSRMIEGWVGRLFGAKPRAKEAYDVMINSSTYKSPLSWSSPDFSLMPYDVLILPGGHDKGVKQIIESESLKPRLREFFPLTAGEHPSKICGAICHGVMVLAWTKDEAEKSLLHDRCTTTLPVHLERLAYYLTVPFLGSYYRTYPGLFTADAVQKSLKSPTQFKPGPLNLTASHDENVAHVVKDGGYISARFPGDAGPWSRTVCEEAEKVLTSS